ncbi:hypothetical protein AHAS_Ahas05G0021000 [Arachis hypogaea]
MCCNNQSWYQEVSKLKANMSLYKGLREAPPVIKETPVLVQDSAKIKEAPPAPNRKLLELDQMLR